MAIVSGTRLHLRSVWFFPPFVWHARRSLGQAQAAPGFLRGRVLRSDGLTFWTLTLWSGEAEMRAYRNSGRHKEAMGKTTRWCDELVTATWEQPGDDLPDWDEVVASLVSEGRFLKLPLASPRHQAREVPPPNTRRGADFPAKP